MTAVMQPRNTNSSVMGAVMMFRRKKSHSCSMIQKPLSTSSSGTAQDGVVSDEAHADLFRLFSRSISM